MALARSASGPGLSINTSSANSLFGSGTTPATGGMFGSTQTSKPGGLFGSTASAPQTGGLFGSTTTSSAPAASGLFGSTTSSAPAAGGLFGSATTSAPAPGGLFGSTAPAQPSGGLFGSTTTAQPAAGGLFGSTAATAQAPGAAQNRPSGSLFGSTTTTQAQPSGGLFGSSTTNSGGGLFGGLNQQTQNKPAGGSLFGGLQNTQQPQAQTQQSGMFGSTNRLGGSTTGQNQQQAVPGVRIDVSNVRGTTRFSDLHEDLQKQITQLDTLIQNQISFHDQCAAFMPSHEAQLTQIPHDVEFCRRKLIGMENGQDSDVQSIAQAAQLVRQDADHAALSFKAIDNLKLPPQYHNNGMWQAPNESSSKGRDEAQDLVSFFSKTSDELAATLEKYQGHISEIENHLRGVEAASAQQINALVARKYGSSKAQSNPVEDLAAVLRDFEQSLLGVAGKVGGAREVLQDAQLDGFGELRNGRNESSGNGVNGSRRGIY